MIIRAIIGFLGNVSKVAKLVANIVANMSTSFLYERGRPNQGDVAATCTHMVSGKSVKRGVLRAAHDLTSRVYRVTSLLASADSRAARLKPERTLFSQLILTLCL